MDWVLCADPPIFVEVKSLFGDDLIPTRVKNALRREARKFTTGHVLFVKVKVPAPNATPKSFRGYLRANLQILPECLHAERQLPDYVDPSGLTLAITCMEYKTQGPAGLGILETGGGAITSHGDIREAVKRAVDQIPDPYLGIRALVVVCPHTFPPIGTFELVGAMLSLPKLNLATGKVTYDLQGIARSTEYTRVSAVATYNESPEGLEVIHNPFARNPIDPKVLVLPTTRQLVQVEPGCMRWLERS
jgi:hypothetical protein